MTNLPNVFLSYQDEDLQWRDKFSRVLQKPNVHFFETPIMERKAFQNKTELQIKSYLKKLLDQTIVHLLLLGNNTFKGRIVTQEIDISLQDNRPMGIIRIPDTMSELPARLTAKKIPMAKWQTEEAQKLLKQLLNAHYRNSFYTSFDVFDD
ncbi:MAG: hypothetical protein GF308_09220 [Candidatus Heimdallarchaeota archaeon]|nr:hypothetical protein [Candidatus Heimdallarchaeota archaeon]